MIQSDPSALPSLPKATNSPKLLLRVAVVVSAGICVGTILPPRTSLNFKEQKEEIFKK